MTLAPNGSVNSQVTLTAINGFTATGTPNFTCTVPSTFTGCYVFGCSGLRGQHLDGDNQRRG